MSSKTGYILGISRGHNAAVCLLKDGEIIFSIEEERLSRYKYDGGPYAGIIKVKEYTDKVDYIVVAHTQSLKQSGQQVDFTGDNVYVGLARKIGLIDRKADIYNHPQVIDLSSQHHKIHAACAFYRSGFNDAVAVVVDGAGTSTAVTHNNNNFLLWEVESIIECSYPANFKTLYKHTGCRDGVSLSALKQNAEILQETGEFNLLISDRAGITKVYEAATTYCGFTAIEAGKTMGLFPYGRPNNNIPQLFTNINNTSNFTLSDRNFITPTYPNGAFVNNEVIKELADNGDQTDVTLLQNRRDFAYAVQTQTQEQVLNLIVNAVELSGKKSVVLSGGYGLNCVANYYYLNKLNDLDINLYVEPISNDGGTAIGAALWYYYALSGSTNPQSSEIYLGPRYNYSLVDIEKLAIEYNGTVSDVTLDEIVDLMISKNIVACFQGRSENGPRALGNRSLMFDPRFEDGKDYVNGVKHREYFRPFAGSILAEDVHEWFDLRGMQDSPHMMYAVNCLPGVEEKIPSIIHVDATCRIQTVAEEENPMYYKIIKKFKEKTGVPIIFNTSFNLGGEPLVETLADALWTLQQSKIEYLYLPEYDKLLTVPNLVKAI